MWIDELVPVERREEGATRRDAPGPDVTRLRRTVRPRRRRLWLLPSMGGHNRAPGLMKFQKGGEQAPRGWVLVKDRDGPESLSLGAHGRSRGCRQHDDRDVWTGFAKGPQNAETVQFRHPVVENDHVRLQLGCSVKCFTPVGSFRAHFKVRIPMERDAGEKPHVLRIISDQHS